MSSPEHKQKIWQLIKDIKVGMLVTLDDDVPHARPMHLVQEEYDGTLWFFTRRSAEKVAEAAGGHDVCLTFSDQEHGVYVSLTGKASLTDDRELIEKYWNPFVAAWFPQGKHDPDVALLEVHVQMGEHWKAKESKVFQLYEFAKANIKKDAIPNLGENQKFGG
ncbi:pyridoxamine 5'-phosphate oxidase family protein [Billgrantia kenyensis]|uniref:Pyridoxamine 5'-phosphate oxidase family protein n=1 Tax=Billgrantia kenyensis TaxID=321266 RepID=A0A7V9W3A7_9GAMM|nr:pyridoxamine 5'-phosphate oxidase family protein [Halomonas kenyensis]MBA2780286.1 pyridoxamine 5'-phosphate oxidase family protein [Halomonas kenyensis]MCG6663202.1 pyridoxamine 5'-phosphate oxidase family protein [Halomonas kenyensis]